MPALRVEKNRVESGAVAPLEYRLQGNFLL